MNRTRTESQALPDDMIFEILTRLPVKSVVQFRCVSNYWCSMIKSPYFITSHLQAKRAHAKDEPLLLRHINREDPYLSLHRPTDHDHPNDDDLLIFRKIPIPDTFLDEIFPLPGRLQLYGPCNGIVCMLTSDDRRIILCNLALREFLLHCFPASDNRQACFLQCGFGYDSSTNSYKVVQIWKLQDGIMKAYLYSTSTHSWSQIDGTTSNFDASLHPRFNHGEDKNLLFNGACHWLRLSRKGKENIDDAGIVLSFNVRTETFRRFVIPDWGKNAYKKYLIVVDDCLAIIRNPTRPSDPLDIWVMKEYGVKESWTKHVVVAPCIVGLFSEPLRNVWIVMEESGKCKTKKIKKSFQFYGLQVIGDALVYQESLHSLDETM